MYSGVQRSLVSYATSFRLKALASVRVSAAIPATWLNDSLPIIADTQYHRPVLVTRRNFILDRQRWVQNAYSRNGIYGPKDKKKLTKVETAKALEKLEEELAEAEKDPFGPERGYEAIRKILMKSAKPGESPPKKDKIHSKLCGMLHRRHALKHDKLEQLTSMEEKRIAQSLLGMDTKQEIPVKHAKIIIEDLWFKGKSPLLEKFARDDERIKRGGEIFS